MSFNIRKMHAGDIAIWAQMRSKLWSDLSLEGHVGEIEDMLKRENFAGYIAHAMDLQPVGFAEVAIRDYANGCTEQPVPFLEGIWVDPIFQRQGIGRILLTKISHDLRSDGYQVLCSDADISNIQSHQAHESWGFHETERVVYFRKPLI